jgi:opine dehydrogenase
MEKIAVIGARTLGCLASADLTLRGFEVHLFEEPRFKELLAPIEWAGGIELLFERYYTVHVKPTLEFEKKGFAKIYKVTTGIEEAIQDVDIIIVAVHAYRHEEIARIMSPHLKDGQLVVISPGNAGSLIFSKIFKELKIDKNILLAETCPALYGGRYGSEYGLNDGQCVTPEPVLIGPEDPKAKSTLISAFPAKDSNKVVEKLKKIFKLLPGSNVLEVSLCSPNLLYHAALSVMSASWIDQSNGKFRLHYQAITPSTLKVVEAIKKERYEIFKVMGWVDLYSRLPAPPPSKVPHPITLHIGPTDLEKHRFIAEDPRIGNRFLASLGDMIGVPTPTMKAVIHLASVITQTDYFKVGRTVESVGLSGMNVKQLNEFLIQGPIG